MKKFTDLLISVSISVSKNHSLKSLKLDLGVNIFIEGQELFILHFKEEIGVALLTILTRKTDKLSFSYYSL